MFSVSHSVPKEENVMDDIAENVAGLKMSCGTSVLLVNAYENTEYASALIIR